MSGANGKRGPSDLGPAVEEAMLEAEEAVERVQAESRDDEVDVDGAEDEAGQPVDELEAVQARLEQTQDELEAAKDKWMRSMADLENYKKRVRRELEEALTRNTQDLLASFLPTVDNLERALEAADPTESAATDQVIKGIQIVRDQFVAALARHGIEPVPSVGEPFDPSVHDALQQMDSDEYPPGTVIREFEKGYRQGKRLLRPARVIVAGAGSTGSVAASSDEGEPTSADGAEPEGDE